MLTTSYDTQMTQLLEFSPLVLFYVAYKLKDIYWATGALMISCVLLMLVHRLQTGKFKTMHVVAAVLALVLGSATLLFRDPRFIQWKLTILMGLTSLAFLGSMLIGRQPLARRMLESAFEQPVEIAPRAWLGINLLWVLWFALLAVANIYIARNFSENVWVNFKMFGITVASIVFMMPQALWLSTKIKTQPAEEASTS
jgi:intracellular septation protein